jgi:hypothetical protein
MGGGLMQLVAYGAQDVYLTGNPQITYFKVVYRRHTNFSIECIEQPVDSSKFGGRQTVQILRNGDLATRMYLRAVLPSITGDELPTFNQGFASGYGTKIAWVRRVGHAMINNIELTIGGSQIDKHWGTWMDVWYELTHTNEQEKGYNTMIGDVSELINLKGAVTGTSSEVILPEYTLYIPLQFWFCRNTGLALPLIALQYHEVRLNIELVSAAKLIVWSGPLAPNTNNIVLGSCGLMVDYIYLDSEERRRFAQVGHEYLIEQLQFGGAETLVSSNSSGALNVKHKLEFNHPTKELVWAPVLGAWTEGNTFLTYTGFDDAKSWELATDAAATNVAEGMFCLGNPNVAGWVNVTGVPIVAAAAGGVTIINSYVGTTAVVIPDLVITVVVKNSSANASVANPLWVNPNVLRTSTGGFLSNNIKSVVVTVTVGTAVNTFVSVVDGEVVNSLLTVSTLLPVGSVQVLSHTLNLTDASLPIGTADLVDNRANTVVDSPAVAPRDVNALLPNNYGLRLDGAGNLVNSAKIQLNGHDRFYLQQGSYFNSVQPAQHHTRTPADGVNVYSFALHPEQHQPSGSANLSRIDTTILAVTYQDSLRAASGVPKMSVFINTNVYIYAFSYNVLRIMSGMGGLAYAN